MAKFSERTKQKKKTNKKGGIGFALGCLVIFFGIPVVILAFLFVSNQQKEVEREQRVKTQYEEGLEASFNKNWVLIGHEFEESAKEFRFVIKIVNEEVPENLNIQYRVKGTDEFLGTVDKTDDGRYIAQINAEDLGAGKHELEAVATSEEVAGKKWTSNAASISISYPLYVVWTMDWEGMAVSSSQLSSMNRISSDHKNLPIVHFFNPRVFSGGIGSTEGQKQIKYVIDRKNQFGDEIGLHLHMWYDIPRAAGVTPRTSPAWNAEDLVGSGGGYDVPVSAYTYDEMVKIYNWSNAKFEATGLGKPVSFRAGGWYLSLENVRALQDTGFKVDSSGRDARFWGRGFLASPWSLGSRTQPYKMSTESLNADTPLPVYDVWQIPNNGADSYWFSAQDMITALEDNYQNKPLEERRIVNILSHPHWFSVDYPKLQEFYTRADQLHYADDKGPVQYTTLEKYLNILETDPNNPYNE